MAHPHTADATPEDANTDRRRRARRKELSMQIYRWWSDALKRYADGHILVIADSLDTARELAKTEFEAWLPVGEERLFKNGKPYDEDAAEELERLWTKFRADIAKDPAEIKSAFFLEGSE